MGNVSLRIKEMAIKKQLSAFPGVVRLLVWTAVAIISVATQTADAGLVLHSTMDNADVGAGAGTDDTGSGDFTVFDTAGTAENGTATESAGPESVTSGATGIIGEALDFEDDGAPAGTRHVSYGDVHDHTNTPLGHTVSIWLNPDTAANGFPMAKGGSNPEAGWALFKVSNGMRLRGEPTAPASGGSTLRDLRRTSGLEVDAWHHFAVVLDDVNLRLIGYVDGLGSGLTGTDNSWTLHSINDYANGENWNSADPLILGNISKAVIDYAFDGQLDDFAIWDEALTAGEVLGLRDVARDSALNYDAGVFDLLKQAHDSLGSTPVIMGASDPHLVWMFASGLGSTEGLSGSFPNFTLVLNGSAGTGLRSALPATGAILKIR
jgi:hypothetical protein